MNVAYCPKCHKAHTFESAPGMIRCTACRFVWDARTGVSQAERDAFRVDLRRRRAESLAHTIFSQLQHYIPRANEREAFKELLAVLEQQGVEVLTDQLREDAGLPARGPDGWTVDELLELEKKRLELISRPLAPVTVFVERN